MGHYNEHPTMVGDRFVKVDFLDCGPYPTAQIFYLIWWETLQAATSTGSGLKGTCNRLVNLLCKFYTRACYPWRVMLA